MSDGNETTPDTLVDLVAHERTILDRIKAHDEAAIAERKRLVSALEGTRHRIGNAKGGLDNGRIDRALQVLKVYGSYINGGQDRGSVVRDAMDWLATGKSSTSRGLDAVDYGTKSYDRWYGQRSDHEWGGPSHGSLIFQIGLRDRKRELTVEERDAAIYFLLNIEAWENARVASKAAA